MEISYACPQKSCVPATCSGNSFSSDSFKIQGFLATVTSNQRYSWKDAGAPLRGPKPKRKQRQSTGEVRLLPSWGGRMVQAGCVTACLFS
jgi:hypothetical protein